MSFCLIVIILVSGCFYYDISPARRAFKEFIANPIPKGISVQEGMVTGFQGYYVYVIFTAEPEAFKDLVRNYELLPNCCKKTTMYVDGKPQETEYDIKSSMGKPVREAVISMKSPECYYRDNMAENSKGIRGISYMFYDAETHEAVFEGSF
ncbi:MAG: hypothetical protein KJ818_01735 [Candidatus Omnitrophica bacterium]|nr:hypothetical protein [Candidatus Omnitrophota bacterium]